MVHLYFITNQMAIIELHYFQMIAIKYKNFK